MNKSICVQLQCLLSKYGVETGQRNVQYQLQAQQNCLERVRFYFYTITLYKPFDISVYQTINFGYFVYQVHPIDIISYHIIEIMLYKIKNVLYFAKTLYYVMKLQNVITFCTIFYKINHIHRIMLQNGEILSYMIQYMIKYIHLFHRFKEAEHASMHT